MFKRKKAKKVESKDQRVEKIKNRLMRCGWQKHHETRPTWK
jgi:hypothetical protein